jgi:anti-sigma B factor antagonist
MKITNRESYGVIIIDLNGRLETTTSGDTSDEIVRIIKAPNHKIIINLEGVEYISSAGLRVILTASKLLQSSRGELKLCSSNDQVKEVLETSGFNSLLNIYNNEKDAMSAFLKEST